MKLYCGLAPFAPRLLRRCLVPALVAVIVSILGKDAAGAAQDVTSVSNSESYSALECLHGAAQLLNRPVDMVALLSSPSFHPEKEHIANQIAELAGEQKLNATVLNYISNDQLAMSSYPIILHVWGGRYSTRPDFYVLCSGVRNGKATVVAPFSPAMNIPLSQLPEDRRGEAVVVSREPLAVDAPVLHRSLPIVQCIVMFGTLGGALMLAFTRNAKSRAVDRSRISAIGISGSQFASLLSVSVVLTIVCKTTSGQSLLPLAPSDAGQPNDFLLPTELGSDAPAKLHDVDIETALRLSSQGALFVDARDLGEFEAGHIRGAIWCPADDMSRWQLHMAGIDPHRRIVVYCAEATCHKGEYVGTFLIKNHFTDVSLFRPGWAKWTGPKEVR